MTRAAPFLHPLSSIADIARTHHVVRMEPDRDRSLRYAVPIPKGWGRATAIGSRPPRPGSPEVIGVFSSRPDLTGPRVIVSVTRLRWEVDPLEWVVCGYVRGGWSIALAHHLDPPHAGRFEVGALREIGGTPCVRRSTGFVDNGRLFRVDVAAPLHVWPSVHDLLWPCGVLFELHAATGRASVEAHPRHTGPSLSFCAPASWSVARDPDPHRVRWFANIEADAQRTAALRIDATPHDGTPQSIDDRRRSIAADLRRTGLVLGDHAELLANDRAGSVRGWRGMWRVDATHRGEKYELRVGHRDTDGFAIDYTMLAPAPGRFHLDWMRAQRALDLAVATTATTECGFRG